MCTFWNGSYMETSTNYLFYFLNLNPVDNSTNSPNHEETTWGQGGKNTITLWSQYMSHIGGMKQRGSCCTF